MFASDGYGVDHCDFLDGGERDVGVDGDVEYGYDYGDDDDDGIVDDYGVDQGSVDEDDVEDDSDE